MDKPRLITRELVNTFIKKRERQLHKGNCGTVLAVAGSEGMAGAALLCGKGALRAGAGLLRVCIPQSLFSVIHGGLPEATCVSRFQGADNLDRYQAAVIGPGLGADEQNALLIKKILTGFTGTAVLDADGLNLLASDESLIGGSRARLIITPHPGEAGRLLSMSADAVNAHRTSAALRLAERYGAVAVLKGAGTIVATPTGDTYINTTGNPGMATGGSGDVLSGIISSLAGQGLAPPEAALAGVYIHGLAGDIGAGVLGEYGLIASDIAQFTGIAISRTIGEKEFRLEETPDRGQGLWL